MDNRAGHMKKTKYKEPTVLLIQLNTGWMVRWTVYSYDNKPQVIKRTFNRCAEAIQFIELMQLHITNYKNAPLRPYKIVG